MKVYLAHPITDYGGTDRQKQAIAALEAHFDGRPLSIENPDQPHHQAGYVAAGMDYFKGVVDSCQALAFVRFPDGGIGAGVGKEIKWAYVRDLWLYELFDGKVYPLSDMPTPVLSVEDTRATIRRLRDIPPSCEFGK